MSPRIQTAVRICEYLETNASQWRGTSDILAALGIPTTARQQTLSTLHSLATAGVLRKSGDGRYHWQLARRDWDRSNPLAYEAASDTPPSQVDAADSAQIAALVRRIETLEASAGSTAKSLTVRTVAHQGATIELVGKTLPSVYPRVLALAAARRNILLVGPAGCGKTYLGRLVADSLGLRFGSLSCSSGMSEAHLLGRAIPNIADGTTSFQSTDFLHCYEEGGVFLLDELDAADPNLLLAINSAIANGYCNVPNRPAKPRAERHPDFVMIATANTFGRGANRSYAGRNQLDEATLDRFRIGTIECDYDPTVETALCPDEQLRTICQNIRRRIREYGLRRVMSTRFIEDAYVMRTVAEWTVPQIVSTFLEGWPEDERSKVLSA